ncbi:F-box/LRR-repeat protein 2 [Achaetomium macrosporum]|uniref:F-box/LRR-repeat protein 2 n=1 Tax=Achaetomium macrosporum TaxID=79813 RepID=A0AAN7CKW2_9PEZI|nr:F-box/LRR-repeat protein 2 [Achaetomium macrosporum]
MAASDNIHSHPGTPSTPDIPDGVLTSDGTIGNGTAAPGKRQRLLRGLQRVSSSPSLARGRSASSSVLISHSGNISCVSLGWSSSSSGQSSTSSYFSQASAAGSSTTYASIPTSPIAESPGVDGFDSALAIRPVTCVPHASTTASLPAKAKKESKAFSLWVGLPPELKSHALSFLRPKELVRVSRVSKEFHKICFDGQLWTSLDASEFYREIPAESLAKIIESAGPFVKDLNLRGCVQVEHYKRAEVVAMACRNLINLTLEGCRNIQRSTLHSVLKANNRLVRLNLTALPAVNNATCKIISHCCPELEMLNVSWCKNMDARGVKFVVEGCRKLKDLRAGEIKGFNNEDVAKVIFRTNNLQRLVLPGCDDLDDITLRIMIQGPNPEIDWLTDRPIVPPRKLRHLDLNRCYRLTNAGVKTLGYLVPDLEGLQLSGITGLSDAALEPILASTPRLTHLELEDLNLTNSLLSKHLAKAPCAPSLEHLSVSSCGHIGDPGLLPVIRNCTRLKSIYMDNTLASDLVLAEAAAMVRERSAQAPRRQHNALPTVGLNLVCYDCQHIGWAGVREVLSRNTEAPHPRKEDRKGKGKATDAPPTLPIEIISLRCYHGWQMTVDEHTKRVLKGDIASARRLERKWADFMQATEEASVAGVGARRRRRRAREAQQAHDQEGAVGWAVATVGGRRRARTTSCAVM